MIQKDDVSDIINRLRDFSPNRIKTNLKETYLADKDSLKLTITTLEKQREIHRENEDMQKKRIMEL